MKRIGNISHENYEPQKLETILRKLELASRTNQGHDYEMVIDQLTIVPRTSDLERFYSFSEFITADSECLTLYTYYGASKQYNTHFFYFKGVPAYKQKNQNLSGVLTADEFEKEQRDKILKELYYEKLETENQELKVKLEESEQKFKEEQQHWEDIKNGKLGSLGEIGGTVLAGILSSPAIKNMFPAFANFGNAGQAMQDPTLGNPSPDQQASFKRKGATDISENEEEQEHISENFLSATEKNYLALIRIITQQLDEQQLVYLIHILRLLAEHPVALKSTNKHIRNFIKCKPKT